MILIYSKVSFKMVKFEEKLVVMRSCFNLKGDFNQKVSCLGHFKHHFGSEILNWFVYLNKSNFVKFQAMLNTLVIVVNTCRCELVTAFPGDVIEAFSRNL